MTSRYQLIVLSVMLIAAAPRSLAQGAMRYLDNGHIRVGIDLDMGGAITYLSRSGTTDNVVNSFDAGREIQQSYYSGPNDFGYWSGQSWPWNPISVGDQWGNHSQLLDFQTDGQTLYTEIIPMQWGGSDPSGTPGDCTFENWVSIEGNVVHVRNRLNNMRADRTWYGPYPQELPAVYTIGRLHRLWTYNGTNPFADEPPVEMPNGFMWTTWRATEGWAAQVDAAGWGLGVYHPRCGVISGGFHPQVNAQTILAGPLDDPTSYMAPNHVEILDWNIAYEYAYDLILDTLDNIRAHAYQHAFDPLPHAVFKNDRAHWTYHNALDSGWPVPGRLEVDVGRLDPMIIGPECGFRAADCPTVSIRMAAHLNNPPAGWLIGQLFFEKENGQLPFSEDQSIRFPVINDGQYHVYTLDLSSVPTWTGFISRLRFDPVAQGNPGDTVEVEWISARPTTLSVQDTQTAIGQNVDLSATLMQGATPVAGRMVEFSVDGSQAGSALTDAAGIAHLSYATPEAGGAGTRVITAAFDGDDLYAPSAATGHLSVSRAASSLYVLDRAGVITTLTILRGYLQRQPGSVGIEGRELGFTVAGTDVGVAVTDSTGRASLNWIIDCAPGTHPIQVTFAGDTAYEPCTGSASLTASVSATKLYVPARTGKIKQTAVLRAYLFTPTNVPIVGKYVTVSLDGTVVGTKLTDSSGRVQFLHSVPEGLGAGARQIAAHFAGDAGFTSADGGATLTVSHGDLYIWPYVRSARRATAHPLKGYVRSLPDYMPQKGKSISFGVDGTPLGTAVSGDDGWAALVWHIPSDEAVGPHQAQLSFAGDAWYGPATASASFQVAP